MRRVFIAVVFGAWCMVAQAVPFEELLYKGRAVPFYGPPKSAGHEQIIDALKRSRQAERMAQVAGTIRLRHDLRVGFGACGHPNAFYRQDQSAIVVCYELVEMIARLANNEPATKDRRAFSILIDGSVWGIFLHELAHAVISINQLPITGREEDVADQFAVYFATNFIEPHGVPVVVPTMWLFQQLASQRDLGTADQESIRSLLANEHSLDGQRVFNLACWAHGAGGPFGRDAARIVSLPQERAARCAREYGALSTGIRARFQKYFK